MSVSYVKEVWPGYVPVLLKEAWPVWAHTPVLEEEEAGPLRVFCVFIRRVRKRNASDGL